MNGADIAIAVIIGLSVIIGLWRGFVVEVLSLAIWVAAIGLAMVFGERIAALFESAIALPSARLALGYGIVFFGTLLLGALLLFVMRKVVQGTGLSGTDRLLGMAFGLVRGAVVVVVIVMLLGLTPFPRDPWWQESRALPAFEQMATRLRAWLPPQVADYIEFDATQLLPVPAPTPERAQSPSPEQG